MSNEEILNSDEQSSRPIVRMYEDWFLDYASYVILDRAVPNIEDGLKPVQRRIMHAMKEMDDGRFNKVANVIGQTMQYHPHGDASIGSAIVNLGQKGLLIETQGNWGDVRTGDSAAASRYIEARLSKFALEIAFNAKTTIWQLSYDGRKREPATLPMKFPLLLAQGADGIAVGLSTKILPHNFCELLDAAIKHLKDKNFTLYPDFETGGMVAVSNYKDGERGGKIRIRVPIEEVDKRTLNIKSVPYGVTTVQLINSILKANSKGKIKIKNVIDNTARDVSITVALASGVSIDKTIDALYAFTDCEVSLSPNACIIIQDRPHFYTVSNLLKASVAHTKDLLRQELETKLNELHEDWHLSSLEKIFIENRIYRDIEEEKTWEGVMAAIDSGLDPYKKLLFRAVTRDDIIRLTEIKIKRISKFDSFKADEHIKGVEGEIEETKNSLGHLVDYTITFYENLLKKYGSGRERKTEIKHFDTIEAANVAIPNEKLFVNRQEGFVGIGLKKDELVGECSVLDDIIVFLKNGSMVVTKVADKTFIGKNIIHVDVFKKNDDRTTYNLLYLDGKTGIAYAKRFNVGGITRDKLVKLGGQNEGSKVLYFSANQNGEAEVVTVVLSSGCNARKKTFDFFFEELAIKGRGAKGNQVTKYPIRHIKFKEAGGSTLEAREIWYDDQVGRLNTDGYGQLLGQFNIEDRIIVFYHDGCYELTDFDLSNHYETEQILKLEKFRKEKPITAVYWDDDKKSNIVKRFIMETQTLKTKFCFIKEGKGNKLIFVTQQEPPNVILTSRVGKGKTETEMDLSEKVSIGGWKSVGNKLWDKSLKNIVPVTEEVKEIDEVAPTESETKPTKPPKSNDPPTLF